MECKRFLLLVLLLTATHFTLFAQSFSQVQPVSTTSRAQPIPVAYQRWIDEDVRWIIQPEERAAFLQLTTDDARDQFIERFWNQRDPTPGTTENEFKEEYYRRIAYANAQFATGVQGWQSDRGHIYIVYGPPDEVTRGTSNGIPVEIWRYNVLSASTAMRISEKIPPPGSKADLEFHDNCRCNDYRLITPEVY